MFLLPGSGKADRYEIYMTFGNSKSVGPELNIEIVLV